MTPWRGFYLSFGSAAAKEHGGVAWNGAASGDPVASTRIIVPVSEQQLPFAIAPDPVPLRMDEHGAVRVGGTRVLLDLVVHAFQEGATAEEIVDRYPTLVLADIYSTIGYYLQHREEVDHYLERRERQGEELRALIEARQGDSQGLRARLLARQRRLPVAAGQ